MFNIGFDCNVADMTAKMKKKPLISGSMAYLFSIFAILIKKKGANLKIELDDIVKYEGPLLLTSLANGCFCGGGIKSNPLYSGKRYIGSEHTVCPIFMLYLIAILRIHGYIRNGKSC